MHGRFETGATSAAPARCARAAGRLRDRRAGARWMLVCPLRFTVSSPSRGEALDLSGMAVLPDDTRAASRGQLGRSRGPLGFAREAQRSWRVRRLRGSPRPRPPLSVCGPADRSAQGASCKQFSHAPIQFKGESPAARQAVFLPTAFLRWIQPTKYSRRRNGGSEEPTANDRFGLTSITGGNSG